jgi:hypothetical protein
MLAALADDTPNAPCSAPSDCTENGHLRAMSTCFPPGGTDRPVRKDLVARVRRAIQAGTYETPEKWAITLRRVLAVLGGAAGQGTGPIPDPNRAAGELGNTSRPSPPIPHPE